MVMAVRRGKSIRAVARLFHVSPPTVQRWVAKVKGQRDANKVYNGDPFWPQAETVLATLLTSLSVLPHHPEPSRRDKARPTQSQCKASMGLTGRYSYWRSICLATSFCRELVSAHKRLMFRQAARQHPRLITSVTPPYRPATSQLQCKGKAAV